MKRLDNAQAISLRHLRAAQELYRAGWGPAPRRLILALLLSAAFLGAAALDPRLVDAEKKMDKVAVRALLEKRIDVNAPSADGAAASSHGAADNRSADDPPADDLAARHRASTAGQRRWHR